MNVLTPYQEVPTESLYFTSPHQPAAIFDERPLIKPTTPNIASSVSSMSSGGRGGVGGVAVGLGGLPIRAELDVQSKGRIINFIYNKMNGIVPVEETPISTTIPNTNLDENGHTSSFYIPPPPPSSKGPSLLDRFTELVRLKPRNDIQEIDKEVLVKYEVTVKNLIMDCQVRLSDMRQANILTTFSDLMDLQFCVEDLTRNPLLFSCQSLKQVFKASYKTLVEHGIIFNVAHLLKCKFKPQDLVALDYSLDELIREGQLNAKYLHMLNYSLRDLVALGFNSQHREMLKITKKKATSPYPGGFGWAKNELYLIVDVSK